LKSVEEIAEILEVTPQLIRKRIRDGILKADRVGNTWVIDPNQLDSQEVLFNVAKDVKNQKAKLKPKKKKPICLSFFSGAMGLDIGLEQAGFQTLLACEIEPSARKTILLNKPKIGLIDDISNFSAEEISKHAGLRPNDEIDLVAGGPPCQAFSTAGKREGFNDARGNVFLTYIDRILELRPRYAMIENVRGLLSASLKHRPHSKRGFGYPPLTPEEEKGGALWHIIKLLRKGGYSVSFNLYNAANFGAPQKRERIILMCSRDGDRIPHLEPTNSENGEHGLSPWITFQDVAPIDVEHEHLNFNEKRLKYYRMLGPGQYWKHLPEELQKEAMGKSYYAGGGKTGFFRRIAWDKPAPTLVTHPTMPATDLAHPEEDRPLSVQEYKRIQQFPDNWEIFGTTVEKYKQIGNAVPVGLGYAAGNLLIKHMNKEEILSIDGFRYSRYNGTDDESFEAKMKEKEYKEPELFS
jgi:DNA (cytosine-5)-methyltransferase 1